MKKNKGWEKEKKINNNKRRGERLSDLIIIVISHEENRGKGRLV